MLPYEVFRTDTEMTSANGTLVPLADNFLFGLAQLCKCCNDTCKVFAVLFHLSLLAFDNGSGSLGNKALVGELLFNIKKQKRPLGSPLLTFYSETVLLPLFFEFNTPSSTPL